MRAGGGGGAADGGWAADFVCGFWQTGEAGVTLFPLTCGVRPRDVLYVGMVINRGWAKLLPALDPIVDMQARLRQRQPLEKPHSKSAATDHLKGLGTSPGRGPWPRNKSRSGAMATEQSPWRER